MDIANEASALNKALEDPVPRMDTHPESVVELYVGLQDSDGEWQTTAIVRELNGSDEEALASLEAKNGSSYADYMSFLLKYNQPETEKQFEYEHILFCQLTKSSH